MKKNNSTCSELMVNTNTQCVGIYPLETAGLFIKSNDLHVYDSDGKIIGKRKPYYYKGDELGNEVELFTGSK